ncbi:MAG: aquaporin [Planctomycetes bacterium]|nr:aquaporin [Planctomycetota bacterium]
MDQSVRSYIAEFVGTFTLVFIGTSVATLQGFLPGYGDTGWLGISFAFGFTLMVLVWVVGPVSGCHINPAVTIPMALSGRLKWSLVPGYLIAQVVGALLASFLLLQLLKGMPGYVLADQGLGANGNPRGMTLGTLFGWELILTALFLFTIFSATRSDSTPGFAGLAIGGFLFVAHLVGAQLGDSSLNPARSIGPAVFEGGAALNVLWVFIVGPVIGGIAGWLLYGVIYGKDGS